MYFPNFIGSHGCWTHGCRALLEYMDGGHPLLTFSVLPAQLIVFLWTSVAGLDIDPLRFTVMQIFSVSGAFILIHGHRAFPGGMDGMTVSMLSPDQLITALLLIVNEGCHIFRIPLSSASSVPLNPSPDLEILQGYPFSNVDLGVPSLAGVIYPVNLQSLVIRSIAAIFIGIGVMENSISAWSSVQSVEGSWDPSSMLSPLLRFRPKSVQLQREHLPQGPRLVSQFQVSD